MRFASRIFCVGKLGFENGDALVELRDQVLWWMRSGLRLDALKLVA